MLLNRDFFFRVGGFEKMVSNRTFGSGRAGGGVRFRWD
jgi:hypothetical protein